MDTRVCDRANPKRWSSSLAIFGYEPPPDQQQMPGLRISYIKAVCTITGYQAAPGELQIAAERYTSAQRSSPLFATDWVDPASEYYPCHGAILEVSVAPGGPDRASVPLSQYPYFADFEPKKRELYELVSQTGERVSRTLDAVSVQKGGTSTNSDEVLDIYGGMSVSGEGSVSVAGMGGGGGGSYSETGQWGSRSMNERQFTDMRTSDSQSEKRDTEAFTTQLSQLYHQLDSYHLGTNRACFFVLPRPHTVETPRTFVNGPRVIEGVQEFFLVVVRPVAMEEICIEAYLETAHIKSEENTSARVFAKKVLQGVVSGSPQPPPRPTAAQVQQALADSGSAAVAVQMLTMMRLGPSPEILSTLAPILAGQTQDALASLSARSESWLTSAVDFDPLEWELDTAVSGDGVRWAAKKGTNSGIAKRRLRKLGSPTSLVLAKVKAIATGSVGEKNVWLTVAPPVHQPFLVFLKARAPIREEWSHTLLLTGRGVCTCPATAMGQVSDALGADATTPTVPTDDWLVYESALPNTDGPTDGEGRLKGLKDANIQLSAIRRALFDSRNEEGRTGLGVKRFLDAEAFRFSGGSGGGPGPFLPRTPGDMGRSGPGGPAGPGAGPAGTHRGGRDDLLVEDLGRSAVIDSGPGSVGATTPVDVPDWREIGSYSPGPGGPADETDEGMQPEFGVGPSVEQIDAGQALESVEELPETLAQQGFQPGVAGGGGGPWPR